MKFRLKIALALVCLLSLLFGGGEQRPDLPLLPERPGPGAGRRQGLL